MKRTILNLILALILIGTLATSCKKDESRPAPTISFLTDAGYTTKDTSVFEGDTILVGLKCIWNGTDAIKSVTIYDNDAISGAPISIPSNSSSEFALAVSITKNSNPTEKMVFELTDAQGERSSISLTLTANKADRPKPTIALKTGGNYTSTGSSVLASDSVKTGFRCKWNDIDALKTITVYLNNVVVGSPINIPSSAYKDFEMDYPIAKSDLATDNWVFELTDSKGQKSSAVLTLNLNTAIKNIWANIGAQQNTTQLSYYSLSTKMNYNAANAKTNQVLIDFLGAYDATNELHLVSPAAPGLPSPYDTDMASWTAKNITKFCTPVTAVTVQQFDNIASEDILISSFSTVTANQKNKAKSLKVNDIYSFLTSGNRYGLFKVTSVTSGLTGKVSIKIKIQK